MFLSGSDTAGGPQAPPLFRFSGEKFERAMVFVPVVDTAHVSIEGQVDGQQTINDLYFKHTTGPIAFSDLFILVNQLVSWYNGTVSALLNEAWTGRRMVGQDMTAPNSATVQNSMAGMVGGVSGEAAPNNCSMAVHFSSGLSGRSFSGRNYIPVLTNSQVSGNIIDGTFISDIVLAYTELVNPSSVLPAGWAWVVASKFSNNLPRVTGLTSEIFTVTVLDNVVDSMRRRLPGRGK